MKARSLPAIPVLWVSVIASLGAAGDELSRLGQPISLGPQTSLVITLKPGTDWRSRFPGEFPPDIKNLAVYEFRVTGDELVGFKTDRSDPSQSDVVAICEGRRMNILKIGAPKLDGSVGIGDPGAYQAKDGRWSSFVNPLMTQRIGVMYLRFDLPAECAPQTARLSLALEVGNAPYRHYRVLLGEATPTRSK
jgi:hypothetical protein